MSIKRMFGKLLKVAALMVGLLVFLFIGMVLHIRYPFEKLGIAPNSLWVMAVDREVRQMPTPAGAELQNYDTKSDGVHLLGYDVARYTWKHNPDDLKVWLTYWKDLGYVQIAGSPSPWEHCKGLFAYLQKTDFSEPIEICHDAESRITRIEKNH